MALPGRKNERPSECNVPGFRSESNMAATDCLLPSISTPPPFANPETISGLGLKTSLITDLFLKHALAAGNNTIVEISRTLKLSTTHAEAVFHLLKAQQLIEVRGMYGDDYSFTLSGAGKKIALERMNV